MVVFTCSYCGESVKKNQVEKHYSISRCRGAVPALTCVDCLKDYNDKEYIAHTSCVTEEERYSAKGFTSKPPKDKGKRKQENWINFIQKCLDGNAHLDGHVKGLLNCVASNPGLPQKKIKFLNYCKNTYRSKFSDIVINEAWEFLDKKRVEFLELQATEKNCEEDKKRKRMDSSNECSIEFFGNGNNDTSKHTPENLGKKKKKRINEQDNCAKLENDVDVNSANMETESSANMETESKKQKKKKQLSVLKSDHTSELENCDNITVGGEELISENGKNNESWNLLSKKEKKEKRKKEKYEMQLLEIHNEPLQNDADGQINNNEETSQKSRKKKKHQENGVKEVDTTVITTNKKKHRQPDIETIENGEDEEQEEISDVKPGKFNWEETVVKLLESKGELPIKRVEKKVVNEYINSGVHVESLEKIVAKFNKKILKMSRVKVKKDIVKLAS